MHKKRLKKKRKHNHEDKNGKERKEMYWKGGARDGEKKNDRKGPKIN